MRILVTGSSGFIGQNLVKHLRLQGHTVCGLDWRPPSEPLPVEESYVTDLLDASAMADCLNRSKPQVVIHLAARTSLKEVPPGSDRYAANTVGTKNLMDAAKSCGSVRRIIFTSTKYVHRGEPPANDRDYQPTTSYGRSKAEMEELVWEHDGQCAEWCIARPTTVWGPGMGKHYQKFLRLLQKGHYIHIGQSKTLKHMAFVGNIVFQYCKLAEAPAEEVHRKVFYLADYQPMIVREWAESLRAALGGPKIHTLPYPVAKMAALVGDGIVRCGYRKFPFTTFRLNNLTIDDICDAGPTEKVCGQLPYTAEQGAKLTAAWFRCL